MDGNIYIMKECLINLSQFWSTTNQRIKRQIKEDYQLRLKLETKPELMLTRLANCIEDQMGEELISDETN